MRVIFFVLLFVELGAAFAQSASYQDADTPDEAIVMMYTSVVAAAKTLSECSVRFPELADSMRNDHETWLEKERRAIGISQYHWGRMSEEDPRMEKMSLIVEGMVVWSIENVANASVPEIDKKNMRRQYCSKQFADLASGIWRSRTPRTYKYMDQFPDRPR